MSLDFVPNLNTYLTNAYNRCILIANELHTCTTVYVKPTKTEYTDKKQAKVLLSSQI